MELRDHDLICCTRGNLSGETAYLHNIISGPMLYGVCTGDKR
jgi:hypothetical protein